MVDRPRDGVRHELDRIVRRERGRLVAGLVSMLGGARLDLAEDVAQEALLAALAAWPYRGMPDNPGAWLARVARNKAIDRLRRARREQPLPGSGDEGGDGWELPAPQAAGADGLFEARISDPELRLMFLCAREEIGALDRLALTLTVVSGFTARETAAVLLAGEAAMAQRLARAKRRLRELPAEAFAAPDALAIRRRLGGVLKVVYLIFAAAYAPRGGATLVRHDVAREALRLARELADHAFPESADAKALAALLCLHSSRLDAREGPDGALVLLRDQDRSAWDQVLIDRGLRYLQAARGPRAPSRYHLEAGIAAAHATAPDWASCDWQGIRALYRRLEAITRSPVVAVSACVADAFGGDPEGALGRLDALAGDSALGDFAPYYVARAEVLRMLGRDADAGQAFSRAMACALAEPVARHLEQRLASLL